MAVELTERLLNDAGGWQAMKLARALLETRRVVSAAYLPPLLKGVVREGDLEYRAGLKIRSASDVENLCTCRPSREWGSICAHSLAVGLAVLRPREEAKAAEPPPTPKAPEGPRFIPEEEGGGEVVALSVLLPPRFALAWERGSLTVGVEVQRGGRRAVLQTLDKNASYRCSAADLRLIAALQKLGPGAMGGMLSLSKDAFLTLLEGLAGHPRVTFGREAAAHITPKPWKPVLEVASTREGQTRLHVQWPTGVRLLLGEAAVWLLEEAVFHPVAPGLPPAYREVLQRDITLPAAQAVAFLQNELPGLRQWFTLSGVEPGEAPQMAPESGRFSLTLEGSLNHLAARLQRVYSKTIVTVGLTPFSENWALPDPAQARRVLCRDVEGEREALARLAAYGFSGPDSKGELILKGERGILAFFAEGYPRLAREWEVALGPRFGNITREVERITPRVEIISSGEEWFELRYDLAGGGGEVFSHAEVQRLLQRGEKHTRLRDGRVAVFDAALLDDFQNLLADASPQQRQPGVYRVGKAHAGALEAAAQEAGFTLKAPAPWREWARRQQGKAEWKPLPLGDLEGTLRPYQKHGAAWLGFLAENGLGGILADDMGLGKTVQALAFLRTQPGPALVVCPSSLLFNWRREVEQFTPEQRLLVIEGSDRAALFGKIREADLVLTSYPLLRRDAEKYRSFEFSSVILDEAQHIKNPDTQNAQAATRLRAQRRFILTGTPVENSVRDLWSLMNFVMPGYLGDRDDFRERYELPIMRHQAPEALGRLTRRLRPFLLRRRKQEVAADLPEKLEQVAYCELTQAQQVAYSALLQGARSEVERAEGEKNAGRARMLMLTALLRLRQAACDLRLLDAESKAASGKVELFRELLEEALDGGHRVLVFSQFVTMLGLLRAELEARGVPYCYLDGQTRDRAAEVDRFQAGEAPVFLISLKAGGTGLNLTAADTVIHFDPWWNPAVEAQATDRAHRIGQKQVVTSYKLITRGTVEEKILNLQRKKRDIIDATVENEQPLMEGLSVEEIRSLLDE